MGPKKWCESQAVKFRLDIINSLLAIGIVANSLYPDQARQNDKNY